MTAKTPGQVAYEAFRLARFPREPRHWHHPAVTHKAWEAAAQAVTAPVRDELAALRHAMAGIAAELNAEAEVTSPSAKSRAQFDAARRIKRALGEGGEVIGSCGTEHLAALITEGGRA